MTAINSTFQINSLPPSSQNSNCISTTSSSNNLYMGSGYTNTPGITNLFYAPYEFITSVKAMLAAEKINDKEGIFENAIRIMSTPFSLLNSITDLIGYILKGGIYFKLISNASLPSLSPLFYYT